MMSPAGKAQSPDTWCECTLVEMPVAYQAFAAATMSAPAAGRQQIGAVTTLKLRIDPGRFQGWLDGHRALYEGPDGEQYNAVFEPELAAGFEGFFNAHIEELPGCVSYGENLTAAGANLREALALYLEDDTADEAQR